LRQERLLRKEIGAKHVIRRGLAGGSFRPLTDSAIEKVHQAVIRIVEEVGFEVNSEEGLDLFRRAGASVDGQKNLVRLPGEKAMELVASAPSEIRLCGQDEKHDILLGGSRVYTGTGGTALNVYHQETGEKTLATLDDLKRIAKLVDHLDNIHLFLLPTYPNELPIEHVDVNRFFAGLDNTSKHVMGGLYTMDGLRQVTRMAEIVAGSADALRQRPIISMIACTISPLKIDKEYGDFMIAIARSGVPVVVPSEPLCGATSPVTLAGNVTVQTVDSLMGVMLTQLASPGAPVIFGSVATSTDMSDFKYLAGSVEMGLVNAAGAQMAQYYKLPFYATGGMTDSKVLDAQSGYESAITVLLCALAGANFIHDAAGLMEFALTACYEKYVVDDDILGMVMRAVEGIRVDEETIAYDLIKDVGPGGNFVTAKHTRRFMRAEHYQPTLSDRNSREDWEAKGGEVTWERAAAKVKEILAMDGYRLPEPARSEIQSQIAHIVA
jgi:trimethylamine--corrinoid protein Co-methyltransferase